MLHEAVEDDQFEPEVGVVLDHVVAAHRKIREANGTQSEKSRHYSPVG